VISILDTKDRCNNKLSIVKNAYTCKDSKFINCQNAGDSSCVLTISFSELKNHVECSYRHKLQYIDKINMFEENVNTNFGTALHESCEHYLKSREMKYELALDYIVEAWKKYDLPDLGQWLKEANAILEAVPKFLDERFPGWKYVSAEEKIHERIEGKHSQEVAFKGYIDGIIEHDGIFYILDWKTSSKGWNKYKKEDETLKMQLVLYAKFWGQKHNIEASKIRVGFVVLNRDLSNPERIEFFTFPIEEKATKNTLKILNNAISMKRDGLYFKQWKYKVPNQQRNCRFCDYNETKYCP